MLDRFPAARPLHQGETLAERPLAEAGRKRRLRLREVEDGEQVDQVLIRPGERGDLGLGIQEPGHHQEAVGLEPSELGSVEHAPPPGP